MDIFTWILALAIIASQLIKLPLPGGGGVNILDFSVLFLIIIGIIRLKFKLSKPPVFILSAFIFIFIAALSLLFTPIKLTPMQILVSLSYNIRFTLYVFLGWIIFSKAFPNIGQNTKRMLIFAGFTLAILGLLQFIFLPDLRFLSQFGWDPHYFRAVSTFLDPNFLGAFLVLTLLLTFGQSKVLFTLVYLSLLFTFSRGAYLAFFTSFLAIAFLRKSIKLACFALILFLILLGGFYSYQKEVATPRGIDRGKSASFRLSTWRQGVLLFSESPILGIGFNAYRYALKEYGLSDDNFLSSRGSSTNDSSLIYVAATTGILGLLAYLFFLFSLIKRGDFILTAGISGLIIQSFFINNLFYPPLLIWIILVSLNENSHKLT